MTFRPYHAQPDIMKCNSSAHREENISGLNLLQDIARRSIVENEGITSLNTYIEIDAMGTVSIRESEGTDEKMPATHNQKRIIRLSSEKTYQRIVEATQRKIDLLERLYNESRIEAYRCFKHSLLIAIIEALVITLSIITPLLVRLLQIQAQFLLVVVGVVAINIINVVITIWILRHTVQINHQVDLYLHNLTDMRHFSNISSFISQLQIDDTYKHLLQRTLVSTSLGISEQSSTSRAGYHQIEPTLENQLSNRTTVQ